MEYLIYILAGALGAFLVGLIGTGSSLIIMPVLVLVFPWVLAEYDTLRLATGTTMATMSVGAIAATYSQLRAGNVDSSLLRQAVIPYLLGALSGPWISRFMPSDWLRVYLSVLLVLVAVRMLGKKKASAPAKAYRNHLGELRAVLFFVGLGSSVAGVASGIFTIPYLLRFALPVKTVIGTSTAGAALYSLFGTAGYISAGWSAPGLPPDTLGFVYLPAFLIMAVVVSVFAPLGVYLARFIDDEPLRRGFALFLLVAAGAMLML